MVALIVALFMGIGFVDNFRIDSLPISAINPEYRSAIFFSAFLILFIPLIALILFAIRVLLDRRMVTGYGSFSMLLLWLTGLAMGAYYGAKMAGEFAKEAKYELTDSLNIYPTIRLVRNSKLIFSKEDSLKFDIQTSTQEGKVLYGDDDLDEGLKNFHLTIEPSDDGQLSLVKEFSARGKTFEKALKSAQRIKYNITQQDSVLYFDKYLTLTGEGLYRNQTLEMLLKVPVNTKIIVEDGMFWRIREYDFWSCKDDEESSVSEWIMTANGLKCLKDLREKNDKTEDNLDSTDIQY